MQGCMQGINLRDLGVMNEYKSTRYCQSGQKCLQAFACLLPPLYHCNKKSSAVVPEQDLCPMPQVRRPRKEGDQLGKHICERQGGSGSVRVLDYKLTSEISMHWQRSM